MAQDSNKPKGTAGKPVGESRKRAGVENLRDSSSELGHVTGTEDFHKRGSGPVASYAKPPTTPKPVK